MKILKNKKLITVLAMLLMVATVVGMGTMTYSRYVTSKNFGQQNATVADWGYVLTINSENLFGEQYEGNVVNETFAATEDDKIDVKAAAEAKIIAPGTSGYMTVEVSGNAEVLAEFAIAVADGYTDVVLKFTDGTTADYYPIVWTLEKTVDGIKDNEATVEGRLSAIVAALDTHSATIAAGETIALTQYKISWSWALGETGINDTNKKDTALGMLAANKTASEIEAATGLAVSEENSVVDIKLDISATVEQIQD